MRLRHADRIPSSAILDPLALQRGYVTRQHICAGILSARVSICSLVNRRARRFAPTVTVSTDDRSRAGRDARRERIYKRKKSRDDPSALDTSSYPDLARDDGRRGLRRVRSRPPDRSLLGQSKGNRIPYAVSPAFSFLLPHVSNSDSERTRPGDWPGARRHGTLDGGQRMSPTSRIFASACAKRRVAHFIPDFLIACMYRIDVKNHIINYICFLDDRGTKVDRLSYHMCNLKSNPIKCV